MSSLFWFYLMLMFWVSWLTVTAALYYWFNLGGWMSINFSFFFIFFLFW